MFKRITGVLLLLFVLFSFSSCTSVSKQASADAVKQNTKQTNDTEAATETAAVPGNSEVKRVKIAAAGDIMFHIGQLDSADNNGNYDFKDMFKDIKPEIESADIAVANFETTINPKRKPSGYPQFNSPVEVLDAIKYAGFDVLTTANNHSMDTGKNGILNNVEMIKSKGMLSSGTGNPEDNKFAVIEKNGIKVGVLSYTFSTNGIQAPEGMINMIDKDLIKRDIDKIKQLCDFTMVYVHTGIEYERQPEKSTVKLFHDIADMGADCVIGNHPHIPRKAEVYNANGKNVFIIYACGNFISAQRNPYTDTGVIVKMDVVMQNEATSIENVEITPVYVLKYKVGKKIMYRVVKCDEINNYKQATAEQTAYAKKIGLELINEDEPVISAFKVK